MSKRKGLKLAFHLVAEVVHVATVVASDMVEAWGTGISRQELWEQNQLLKARVHVLQQELTRSDEQIDELLEQLNGVQ